MVDWAAGDLSDFDLEPILQALKASPDGVPTWKFHEVVVAGINLAEPKEVAQRMRRSNAIVYHPPSGEYRLATRAHRTALLELWGV